MDRAKFLQEAGEVEDNLSDMEKFGSFDNLLC